MAKTQVLLPRPAGLILLCLLFSCKDPTASDAPADSDVAWLRDNVLTLASTDPPIPEPGFPTLGAAIGEARLVGLGEATHGTREFWTMRRKISRYLVEQKEFTAILHEAPFPSSLPLEAYVTRGEGTLASAHEALGYWRYQEMQDLIAWMRQYNLMRASGDPVLHYFGYDCAAADWSGHAAVITEYLDRVDPASTAEIEARLGGFTLEDAAYVRDFLAARAEEYSGKSSEKEFAVVLRVAELLEPTWRVVSALQNGTPDGEIRESCAAENVNWIVQNLLDGGKAVIWAHDAHIGNPTLGDISGTPTQWLGTRLKNQLGAGYYMLGAEFYGGSFLALEWCEDVPTGITVQQAATPPEDTYARAFHRAGIPLFFLDLDRVDYSREGAAWLQGPRDVRFIGADYCEARDSEYYFSASLPTLYDGIVFFDQTSAVTRVTF